MLTGKLLIVLLAVLVESRRKKTPLKLNGSSSLGYQPLKIRSTIGLKSSESNVPLKFARTASLENVPVHPQDGSVIPGDTAIIGRVRGITSLKENYELNQKRYEILSSETLTDVAGSPGHKEGSIPVRSSGSSLIDNVLDYFNFGVKHNNDLKIDPEFEHLPEGHYPKIDPEFEHLPATESSSNEDWIYDFPTEKQIPENIRDANLQKSAMLTMGENGTDPPNVWEEEYYYFDDYVDESEAMSANSNDTTKHNTVGLKTIRGATEKISAVKTDYKSPPNNTIEITNPRGNIDIKTSDLNEYLDDYDYSLGNDLIYHSLKNSFFDNIDSKFRSLVFNPAASPHESFQECKTPRNETGNCRYVQHCFLPNIIASLGNFLRYVCIIQERFVGICCPEFPVHTLDVNWKLPAYELQMNSTESITQPEDGCGVSSKTRIIGGGQADPKEWPWMAALLSQTIGNFFCGGALINSKYVLTAAHCTFRVPQNQILVRLGEYDFGNSSDGPGEDYPVVEIKRHALYSRKTLRNDIALLKLGRSAKFGQFISTICLPESNARYIGQSATLAGWGNVKGGGPTSKVLLEASFPVWSNAECASVQGIPIRKGFMCAGDRAKTKGACNGDSGGPLMLLDERTKLWKAIGIVSWGRRGCDPGYPTVFTSVSNYLRWIKVHSTD